MARLILRFALLWKTPPPRPPGTRVTRNSKSRSWKPARKGRKHPENTVSLLRVLARIGSTEALPAVRNRLEAAEVEVRDAAVRALVDWQDASAADDLFRIVEKSPDAKHRALALRALLRLAAAEKSASWVDRIKPLARTPEEKKQLLGTLAGTGNPVALEVAVGMMAEAEVSPKPVSRL